MIVAYKITTFWHCLYHCYICYVYYVSGNADVWNVWQKLGRNMHQIDISLHNTDRKFDTRRNVIAVYYRESWITHTYILIMNKYPQDYYLYWLCNTVHPSDYV